MHGRANDPHAAYDSITFRFRVAGPEAWRPALEVYETATALVVRVELAGVDQERLAVALDSELLVIEGERAPETGDAEAAEPRQYHEMGLPYGPFRAQVRLPFAVERDGTEAEYEHGFLTVRLPRAARAMIPAEGTRTAAVAADDSAVADHTQHSIRKGDDA